MNRVQHLWQITTDYALEHEEHEEEETRWIKKKFKKRVCTTFIGKNDSTICECGYERIEHGTVLKNPDTNSKWDPNCHTKLEPTNAFGDLLFVGHGENKSKYIRVDKDTDMKDMMKLMTKFWKLESPKLLISVTGGAKSFNMSKRLTETFQRGLIKAARSTGAWIVTGGSNAGVMKHVGEAIHKYGHSSASPDPVIAIGIAVWGCMQNKDVFTRKKSLSGRYRARYKIEKKTNRDETFLNPNHSHFILVDDGTCHKFGGEIEFRGRLQKEVTSQTIIQGRDTTIPVVTIVLEGGEFTLGTINESIKHDIPVVIIEGSGRIADIVAYAYQNSKWSVIENEDSPMGRKKIVTKAVKKEIIKLLKEQGIQSSLQKRTDEVISIVQDKPDLITIFRLSTFANTTQDIDVAILQSLLKGNKNNVFDQLKLALIWNRIDIAKTMDMRALETPHMEILLENAIEQNKVDFLEMFLDSGVSMQEFLTMERLLRLYESSTTNQIRSFLQQIKVIRKNKNPDKKTSLEQIGLLLQHLIGKFFMSEYLLQEHGDMLYLQNKKKLFTNPYQHLFIWSILMNRKEMSTFFWKQGKDKIPSALVGSAIMNSLAKVSGDTKQAKEMKENAVFFSSLAIDSIKACDEANEIMTSDILVRQNSHWGYATCLTLAVESNNKHFIAHSVCKSLLQRVWYGELSTGNSTAKIFVSMLCPLFLPLVDMRDDETTETGFNEDREEVQMKQITENGTIVNSRGVPNKAQNPKTDANLCYTGFMKFILFYRAPVVKFFLNVISYIIFLSYFSYVLLVQFDEQLTNDEIIIWVWVCSIFADEFRQHFQKTGMKSPQQKRFDYKITLSSSNKILKYASNVWIFTDGVAILLLLIAVILRSFTQTFEASRVCLGITLIVFFFRTLNIFSVHRRLGPTIVMIGRMFVDMLYFLIILMVFVIAYAIAAYSIMYPNSVFNGSLIMNVMSIPYWNLYGELFVDELQRKEPECTFIPSLFNNGTLPRCPTEVGTYVVPVLMGIYVMFSNILLLNLLIALFSNTVSRIQANTDLHWHFQRYFLISRYETRPPMPQPFVLLYYIFVSVRWMLGRCIIWCKKDRRSMLCKAIGNTGRLENWERTIVNANLHYKEASEIENLESRIKNIHDSLEMVSLKVDEVHDMSTKRLSALENQIDRTSKILSRIEKFLPMEELKQPEKKKKVQKKMKEKKSFVTPEDDGNN